MKTRIFLILILSFFPLSLQLKFNFRSLLSSWDRIPSRSLAGLYYLFKGYSVDGDGGVLVSGPVVSLTQRENGRPKILRTGYVTEVNPEDFEEEQLLAQSIFEASTRLGTGIGTAFLVGEHMVLTNRHVMNYSGAEKNLECGEFFIRLNLREEKVSCKKVRFCSSRYDVCVVEMQKTKSGETLGELYRPLRLSRVIKEDQDAHILHIGNAGGFGIQASHGRGIRLKGGEIFHFAPTIGGSSGAPVFNEKREVIGINWGHTGRDEIDENSFNRAVSVTAIYEELRRTHPYTLQEIKSFRSWSKRAKGIRHASISPQAREPERFPSASKEITD